MEVNEPSWHAVDDGYFNRKKDHSQQPQFPSETQRCSGWLWPISCNFVPCDREFHASGSPGNGSHCISTSFSLHLECCDVYVSSEQYVWYTLRRGFCYPAAECHILFNCYCNILDAAFSPYMFSFEMLLLRGYLIPIINRTLYWIKYDRLSKNLFSLLILSQDSTSCILRTRAS